MNKDLIKKYKAEFDHWLEGGNVLYRNKEWENPDAWTSVNETDFFNRNFYDGFEIHDVIIDDEYVEFRKALAEGKTVQYYVDSFAGWQDVTTIGDHSMKGIKEYRIKPDETKFKVGDWVVSSDLGKNEVLQLICYYTDEPLSAVNPGDGVTYRHNEGIVSVNHLTLWKPQTGEWCWFWDDGAKSAQLRQFKQIATGKPHVGKYKCKQSNYFDYCEPFIGALPFHLKGQ